MSEDTNKLDVISVAGRIDEKIRQIEQSSSLLKERSLEQGEAIAQYYKERAKVIIQLRNGIEFELDGVKVVNPAVSNVESIARGICWKEKLRKETAEGLYRSAVEGTRALQAELNGLQSIYKHLDEK